MSICALLIVVLQVFLVDFLATTVQSYRMALGGSNARNYIARRELVAIMNLRRDIEVPDGFDLPRDMDGNIIVEKRPKRPKEPIVVQSVDELRNSFKKGYRVKDLDVRGDIACLLDDPDYIHPVVKSLHDRKAKNSTPGNRHANDHHKIALAIEGGGMRGAVGGGMASAIHSLGLSDAIDVVYGSSAGSLVGAYFIAEQVPKKGLEVYHDILTTAGKDFIDSQRILRSIGLGLFDLRLKSIVELFTDRMGKPVLNLNYLLDSVVQKARLLDWDVFWQKQQSDRQPLKVVASGLVSRKAVVMSAADGNFATLPELCECMRASMLIPGVAGDAVRLKGAQAAGDNIFKTDWPEFNGRKRISRGVFGSEPMTDALVYEPIPYRSALAENCTQVIVLRTRGDDVRTTVGSSIVEKMIMRRFFGRKQKLPDLVHWMHNQYHKLLYAEDILRINAANRDLSEIEEDASTTTAVRPRLYGIAKPAGVAEVARLETGRREIVEAIRTGFAAAYDALVLDTSERGNGYGIAKTIWPDSLLEFSPPSTGSTDENEDSDKDEDNSGVVIGS